MCGNPNLDFEALERNSKYEGGFSVATAAVQWLWQVSEGAAARDVVCWAGLSAAVAPRLRATVLDVLQRQAARCISTALLDAPAAMLRTCTPAGDSCLCALLLLVRRAPTHPPTHPQIVKRELTLEEKKKFLKFFTGSDR